MINRSSSDRSSVHYVGLDLMRLLAALLVVLDHFGLFGWRLASAQVAPSERAFPILSSMSQIGSVGVEVFFLISGFVISASTLSATPRGFALRRLIRLLPALWICSAIAFVARLSVGEPLFPLLTALGKSMVLSPQGPYIDGVIWTIVVEAVFYACVFACLLSQRLSDLATLSYVLGVVSGLFVVALFVVDVPLHGVEWAARAVSIGDRFPFKVFLLRHGVFFSAGMLIWNMHRKGVTAGRLAFLVLILFACSLEIAILKASLFAVSCSLMLWWLSLSLLICCTTRVDLFGARHAPVFRTLVSAGKLSYPIYLCHYSLGLVLVFWLSRAGLSRPLVFGVALAVVVSVSAAVTFLAEARIQGVLRARWLPAGGRARV